jgi:hypothetical protein
MTNPMATKTYMTYQTATPTGFNDQWTTVISDVYSGAVYAIQFTASEQEGRDWAEGKLNGGKVFTIKTYTNNPINVTLPSNRSIDLEALSEIDRPAQMFGGFGSDYDPPPKPPKPEVPVTCYCCGAKLDSVHTWDMWSDELTLTHNHCGKRESKRFTLKQANELAKSGWMAFLS